MFDSHNHLTEVNSILCNGNLLPQNINDDFDYDEVRHSEIGLDKRYINRVPMEKQIHIFSNLLSYAKTNKIPVSLHCVHATDEMIRVLKEIKPEKGYVLWHGFNGSKETARELAKLEIVLSIGPGFNKNIKQIYEENNHIAIESDYEGNSEEQRQNILFTLYKRIANNLNITVEQLEEIGINETKAFKN